MYISAIIYIATYITTPTNPMENIYYNIIQNLAKHQSHAILICKLSKLSRRKEYKKLLFGT